MPACSCPLTYAPVVHPDTGLPFFNECLARCQLLLPAATLSTPTLALHTEAEAAAAAAAPGATVHAKRLAKALSLVAPPADPGVYV